MQLRGWQQGTHQTALDVAAQLSRAGLDWMVFTDIARDGLQTGFNLEATHALAVASGLNVIASGGVRDEEDVFSAQKCDLAGIIIGRALYEEAIDLKSLFQKMGGVI